MALVILYCVLAGMFIGYQLRRETCWRRVALFDLGTMLAIALVVRHWGSAEDLLSLMYAWIGFYWGVDT